MIYDTTFVIHLEREFRRKRPGPASAFLQAHPRDVPCISLVTVAEFAEGFEPHQEAACRAALKLYTVLDLDPDIAWRAGQLSRLLGRSGLPIGDNDLWIAATALHHQMPLVTRNTTHFQRIPGLIVISC
ncbi:MAG: type II toxin-antitoxin system VapC family toxin [Verrucomicrobia bacterium]|nr:type II toxin-antitoxin system VapC family toxin [Verrucomicrobiota bacterium]